MTISANGGRRWRLAESQRAQGEGPFGYLICFALSAIPFGPTHPPTFPSKFPWPPWSVFHGRRLIAKKSRFLNPIFLIESLVTHHHSPFHFAVLIATADPTRIGILPVLRNEGSDHRESKELGCGDVKILRAAEAVKFLTATVDYQNFAQLAQNTPLNKILTATRTTFLAFQLLSPRRPFFLLRYLLTLPPPAVHATIRVHTSR
jgi:hypothetical protein